MYNLTTLTKLVKNEDGVAAVEYGLIAAAIAIVVVGAFQLVGTNLNTLINDVAGSLTAPAGP